LRLIRTTRQVAPSAQFLRLALRASAELKRTADKEPLPVPPVEMDPHQKLSFLLRLLCDFRREAEQEGRVTKTDDEITIVEKWLAALLGDKPDWLSDSELAPGSPLAELSEFYPRFLRSLKTLPEEDEAPTEPADPSSWGGPPAGHSCPSPSTLDVERETSSASNPSSNTSNASNPSYPEFTPTPSPSTTSSPKTENRKPKTESLYERRLAHEQKLEQLADLRRRGLPYHIVFDPEDGPLPTPSSPPHGYTAVEPGPY